MERNQRFEQYSPGSWGKNLDFDLKVCSDESEAETIIMLAQGVDCALTMTHYGVGLDMNHPRHDIGQIAMALDPGFGNTKVALAPIWKSGKYRHPTAPLTSSIQTAVSRANDIGSAGEGMKVAATATTVTWHNNGQAFRFATGPNAWLWGTPIGSMDYTSLASPERLAMMYHAIHAAVQANQSTDPESHYPDCYLKIELLAIGLPVPLMMDGPQFDLVKAGLRPLKGNHKFTVDGVTYEIDINRIKVVAQPVGAYTDWLITDNLKQRRNGASAEIAVPDIGMNTLDLYVVSNGQVTPRFIGGAKAGTRRLLDLLQLNGHDIPELDHLIRSGKIKPSKQQKQIWLGEILAAIEPIWPSLARFDAVIPTGGGAQILRSELNAALIAKRATVNWPAEPVLANAIGIWKWAATSI